VIVELLADGFIVEEFEEGVDALHQLTADLRASALDQMHRDAGLRTVGEADVGVIDEGDLGRPENAHPVDKRAALSGTLDQFELARHPGDLLRAPVGPANLSNSIYVRQV
jgi:hypothetical protein